MNSEITWKDVVAEALRELGGQGHLSEIAEIARKHPKSATNSRVDEKVRQVVRSFSLFESISDGSGNYRLREEALGLPFIGAPTTKEITDQIQGQLLYIGKANGFETYAPADDQTKRTFDGQPLRELVTLRDGLEVVERLNANEKKIVRLIDVLWLREERGELLPYCAFEVEHSTDVLTGLERLNQLPPFLQTKLFIVGRDDSKKAKFDSLMKSSTWKADAARFQFRFFGEVNQMFNHASAYHEAQDANAGAMNQFVF